METKNGKSTLKHLRGRFSIIFFSAKRDTEPRPIRGFLRDPDFRRGRDPLTGREGYSTIYEARKKVNTLVSHLLIG